MACLLICFWSPDTQRFRTLPLMPVEGGRLVAPAARPVVSLGAWAPGVGSALMRLGCRLVDASRLPEVVVQVGKGQHCTATTCPTAVGFCASPSVVAVNGRRLADEQSWHLAASKMFPFHCRCSSLFILQAVLACWLQLGVRLWRQWLVARAQRAHPTRAARQ